MQDLELSALHSAIHQYLTTITAVGECMRDACPPVGGPFRVKFDRLRARLAFDSNPSAIEESSAVMETELKRYASQAANYLSHQTAELRNAVGALEEMLQQLSMRQEFYAGRLRQLAGKQHDVHDPMDGAGLERCVESMSHELQSLLAAVRDEIRAVEHRVAQHETTDRQTGLTNRREIERQIKLREQSGELVTLIHFELSGKLTDDIVQQIALRLATQFRPGDVVARWAPDQFMVLFQGTARIAEMRRAQVVPWIAGRYPSDHGDAVDIGIEGRVTDLAGVEVA